PKVRSQLLYCLRGWTRLLYEDQGPSFVMEAGGCVLQPPEIRHRVLECAPGTEVLEIGCPAVHETVADPELALPTPVYDPERDFSGQTFLHHEPAKATWEPSGVPGFRARDLGIARSSGGLADARVLQNVEAAPRARRVHDGEVHFAFVPQGSATVAHGGHPAVKLAAAACVVP